jgi:exopolyphosphatase / guanosine-5'-triphosphate,3'-diphosphate pyrophosphatase
LADQPIAVIDIGSNSGRMIVVRSATGNSVETLAEARAPLRLASDIAAGGTLTAAATERTLDALEDFLALARGCGASRVIAVATAAVRDATNGEPFINRIRNHAGVEIEVIDGDREAKMSYLGAVHSLPVESGTLLDVGGGSIELTRFRDRRLNKAWTLPLGALLMADRFFTEDPPSRGERRRLVEHVAKAVGSAIPGLSGSERLVGTGGTIRNLAKMDRRERSYPIPRLHGYVLTLPRVETLVGLVETRPLRKRETLAGLNPDRADSIVAGALIVRALMEALGADEMTVSGKGLREGLAMESLSDRMPRADDVRSASIGALAAHFATDKSRAERRSALASQLFREASPTPQPETLEMLQHACTILDAGLAIDAYNRHDHAANATLSGDLSGFSHPQLALVAAILRRADKQSAGLKPFRALLSGYEMTTIARAAAALAVADAVDLRLPPGSSAMLQVTRSTVTVTGPLRPGRWSEMLSQRTQAVLGRTFVVKNREDES